MTPFAAGQTNVERFQNAIARSSTGISSFGSQVCICNSDLLQI